MSARQSVLDFGTVKRCVSRQTSYAYGRDAKIFHMRLSYGFSFSRMAEEGFRYAPRVEPYSLGQSAFPVGIAWTKAVEIAVNP